MRPIHLFLFALTSSLLHASTFDITDFGAKPDGATVNTAAIQKAIDKCRDSGGGTVVIPRGVFRSGSLRLYSHVHLKLQPGAVLKGSPLVSDYTLDGKRVGLIYAEDAEDISITGEGKIDGAGDLFMDLKRPKQIDSAGKQHTRQKDDFRRTDGLGDGPVTPLDRPFQLIIFSNCKNVRMRDVLISNSPFWTVHFADCDGVVVSGVRIWNSLLVPNADGLDFTSCSNVLVSDCDIRTGDDAIAITGYAYHFDLPGYQSLRHVSENITVTNCTLVSRSSGIRVGGWDQNTMRNYVFSNITIADSNRGINLCVRDEGSIEDMIFSNIVINTRLHTGDWWGNGEPVHLSAVRGKEKVALGRIKNIKFSQIIAKGESGILVYGTPESVIEDVVFRDVSFHLRDSALNATSGGNFDLRPTLDPRLQLFAHDMPAFYAQRVRNLQLHDVEVTWGDVKAPYFTHAVEITDFEDVTIAGLRADPAPGNPNLQPIALRDGSGSQVTGVRPARLPAPRASPLAAAPADDRLKRLGKTDARAHDPSTIVRCKDEYWLFRTGRGLPSLYSRDLKEWEEGPRVFSEPPSWIREVVPGNRGGADFWAPDIIHLGDRYLLYYSVSVFGKNTSAIGLATNRTLDPGDPEFRWIDEGVVIRSSSADHFNTIDPAVTLDQSGRLWLAFGSFWTGIKLVELDPRTGKRIAPDSPMHSLAHKDAIEAAYIYRHGGYYYLFVNWGICCRGTKSTYSIHVGRSKEITGPYVDRKDQDMLDEGGELFAATAGEFIGPGHAGIIEDSTGSWVSMHFYDGTQSGRPMLAVRPLRWSEDGWPELGVATD